MGTGTITTMAYAKERGSVIPQMAVELDEAPDSATMMTAAGLDFEVELAPLYAGSGTKDNPQRRIQGRYATRRTDTLAVLGVGQTDEYEIVQNQEALHWMDSIIEDGILLYETAGTFGDGERCWALARFPEDALIVGDVYRQYMFLTWGHGGWLQFTGGPTNVRVRCENTYAMALSGASFKIRHTRSIRSEMEQAKIALQVTTQGQRRLAEFLERAAVVNVTSDDLTKVEEYLFGPRTDRSKVAEGSVERFNGIVAQEVAEYGRTAYALFNGITGYADHVKAGGVKFDASKPGAVSKRFRSAVDGSAAEFKVRGKEAIEALITA